MLRMLRIFMGTVALLPLPALAAHPLVTDDTGTQGDRRYALELNGEVGRDRSPGALDEGGELAAIVSIGAGDRVDLVVGFPLAWSRSRLGDTVLSQAGGPSDATLELKWRFLEVGDFSLALKPGLNLPTGDPARGLGTGRPGLALTLIASQTVGPVSLHLNGGYARVDHELAEDAANSRHDVWSANAAVAARLLPGLQVVANVGTESPGSVDEKRWPAFLMAGAIWSLQEDLDVDLGARFALNEPDTDMVLLAGAAYRF